MTAVSPWDDPDLRVGGDYIKFENIGDSVTGVVVNVGMHRWDDGSVSPQIVLDTVDGEKTITAGQIRLKVALAEKRPEIDDTLTIKLTDIEKRAGGKTLKHFEVDVVKASGGFKSAPIAAEADPLEGMDPEQVELLRKKLGATPF